jgi:polyisoprenyl-phosphate glycosyltransferase
MQISVVIPVFDEDENIELLFKSLVRSLHQTKQTWEVIFVDDGSKDKSFEIIKKIHNEYPEVIGISLSRNFGHQIALLAGMQHAKGEVVITMDADLQHPPETIPKLLNEYNKGFDIINTRRTDSKDTSWFKKSSSRFFYKLINLLSDSPIYEASSDFRLMSRKAVEAFLNFEERDRFTRGLVSWMGFSQTIVGYNCPARVTGKSKYTLRKMMHFALDGITSFSAKPLRIASYTGFFIFFLGLIYAIYAVIQFYRGTTLTGWTSLLVTILIIGGIQLLTIGIIGEYISRIFNETKRRPAYFIKDQTT